MVTRVVPSNLAETLDSKEKIWRAAERLFSTYGYKDVSVRKIAKEAGTNIALISYYFGSKLRLFTEIYEAHEKPIFAERRRALNKITAGGRKPELQEVLQAWILPWLRTARDESEGPIYRRLSGALAAETSGDFPEYFQRQLYKITNSFLDVLQQCLPHLSRETLIWRLYYMIGGIAFVGTRRSAMLKQSGGKCDPDDMAACVQELLPFAIAGFSAPEARPRTEYPSYRGKARGGNGSKRKKAKSATGDSQNL
jgi:AcrR family transcriptional regulator